ncbi:MAG TPA: hypothetical protein VK422_17320, partial [Pyrinomonadaceae bacterium]|nr:hypothetical protein [Pyrinomonadaceae bacterium]
NANYHRVELNHPTVTAEAYCYDWPPLLRIADLANHLEVHGAGMLKKIRYQLPVAAALNASRVNT